MVEGGGRVFWAVQGVLVGGLALLAGFTLQREVAIHKLHTEVGELKGLLVAFSGREIASDEKAERERRQIDLASRPEMLDYSYSGSLPPSNLNLNNLTVYWKLAGSEQSRSRNGLSRPDVYSGQVTPRATETLVNTKCYGKCLWGRGPMQCDRHEPRQRSGRGTEQ